MFVLEMLSVGIFRFGISKYGGEQNNQESTKKWPEEIYPKKKLYQIRYFMTSKEKYPSNFCKIVH